MANIIKNGQQSTNGYKKRNSLWPIIKCTNRNGTQTQVKIDLGYLIIKYKKETIKIIPIGLKGTNPKPIKYQYQGKTPKAAAFP